jgi:hypothetical protein
MSISAASSMPAKLASVHVNIVIGSFSTRIFSSVEVVTFAIITPSQVFDCDQRYLNV